jgi:putative ABC transport system ATP-binding protein
MPEPVKQAIVCVERLSKYFGAGAARVNALVDINMEVYPGQVVGLMGPSGSGKTTLLNCIACILQPSNGRITLDGETVYDDRWLKADLRRLRLDKIGFIFQYPNLLPFLDATDNVAVVLQLAGFGSAAALTRAVELLDYLEVGHRRHAMPSQLSGGEAQRVAIARALANRPRIILADEPTAPLDSQRARIVMDLLRRIAVDQEAAIICVTHDEMIIDRFDHIFRLRDGRLETESPLAGILKPRPRVSVAIPDRALNKRERTPVQRITIVAHSSGGIIGLAYVRNLSGKVSRRAFLEVAFLLGLWSGSRSSTVVRAFTDRAMFGGASS